MELFDYNKEEDKKQINTVSYTSSFIDWGLAIEVHFPFNVLISQYTKKRKLLKTSIIKGTICSKMITAKYYCITTLNNG